MTMNVHVGSKSQAHIVVTIEGRGWCQIDVERDAINSARGLHRISDPIVLPDNHESAKRVRLMAEQKHRELVRSMQLIGRNKPFYAVRPDSKYYN